MYRIYLSILIVVFPFSILSTKIVAQQSEVANNSPLFISSLDGESLTPFSADETVRHSRPPSPSKEREDLFYPDGFLALSSSVSGGDNRVLKSSRANDQVFVETDFLHPLDPSVETTPLFVPSPVVEHAKAEDSVALFFVLSIAFLGVGVFLYSDFCYRNRLKEDMNRNVKLYSSCITLTDLKEDLTAEVGNIVGGASTSVLPLKDDIVEDTSIDSSLLIPGERVAEWRDAREYAEDVSVVGDTDILHEQNFDFSPKSEIGSGVDDEVTEDFIVSTGGSTIS